jgi:hypothetical protein
LNLDQAIAVLLVQNPELVAPYPPIPAQAPQLYHARQFNPYPPMFVQVPQHAPPFQRPVHAPIPPQAPRKIKKKFNDANYD